MSSSLANAADLDDELLHLPAVLRLHLLDGVHLHPRLLSVLRRSRSVAVARPSRGLRGLVRCSLHLHDLDVRVFVLGLKLEAGGEL